MKTNSKPHYMSLPPEKLRWRCDPALIPFQTTAELEPVGGDIGQERALRALRMGVEMTASGYNLFVCGLSGIEPRGNDRADDRSDASAIGARARSRIRE